MNSNNLEGESQLSKKSEAEVREAWQETHAMGGNDAEGPAFQDILKRLHEGACSGEQAVKEAHEILERKQSYH
ncbi:MAG: hypothetical protein EXS59_01985 [Candidatus Taylorbacteria bacterium]|nr:hypothetical protein [Candidatus Taylorbacteria bacterium]